MPLSQAVEYVAAAYIVVFLLVLIYVSIMASRLRRVERDLSELLTAAEARTSAPADAADADVADAASDGQAQNDDQDGDLSPPDVGRQESSVA